MRIGIVSDTHGFLRREVIEGLQGVDHIIHAGDIDKKEVLDELGKIAPVTTVRGNADKDWAAYLPEKALLEFEGNKIYVIHNKGKIDDFIMDLPIIIYGHSHKYSLVEKTARSGSIQAVAEKEKRIRKCPTRFLRSGARMIFLLKRKL